MRIRSTLAGLALGAGMLVLSSPAALADTNPQPPTSSPTRTTTRPAPPTTAPAPPMSTRVRVPEATPTNAPGRPQVVKPRGAAETGGGMEDASTNTGMFVIGGVALAGLAGGGTLAFRRLRKQN